MSNCSFQQGLKSRLWVIDIPMRMRDDFVKLVTQWKACSGEEWTIKRLKSLKVDLFRMKGGLPTLTWVRKNRKGNWKGVIGMLFRYAGKSDKNFRKVVQTFMCYTMFQFTEASPSQVKKFTSSLSAHPPSIDGSFLTDLHRSVKNSWSRIRLNPGKDCSLLTYRGSPSKWKPSQDFRSVRQDSHLFHDLFPFEKQWGQDLLNQFNDQFRPVLEGIQFNPAVPMFTSGHKVDPLQVFGGKVGFIQEPGGKLRSVASPFLVFQLALKPLGDSLYRFVRTLPWDCTHNQNKPIPVLQDKLRRRMTVHSVDLSSATDYFPLEFQLTVLRALMGNIPDIDLFEIISRSNWVSPVGTVRWFRGQPLGLYPSFACFTICHGILLWYLNNCSWNDDFYVVGDDVVILNDNLHAKYIEILKLWSCPISTDKSISSKTICEFAGKVITSSCVFPQYKWREMSNDNFVDICRQLGKKSRILLTKKQKQVFDLIANLVAPIGLNFSYPGSNYLEMTKKTLETLGSKEERILDSLVDIREVITGNLYRSPTNNSPYQLDRPTPNQSWIKRVIETFDEKVDGVLSRILSWYTTKRKHDLASVPDSVHDCTLPPAVPVLTRITALDRLRSRLGLDHPR
jgi:hypothetical protein